METGEAGVKPSPFLPPANEDNTVGLSHTIDMDTAIQSYMLMKVKTEHETAILKQRLLMQQFRPCKLYPVTLQNDGLRWQASYGTVENEFFSADGVGLVAYGMSPEEAMQNFDAMWVGNTDNEEENDS